MVPNKKQIEIEIQVQVEHTDKLFSFLQSEAKFKDKRRQVDIYYSPASKLFTDTRPVKEWLRLRDSEDEYSLNYKNWHYNESGRSHHCDEYQTIVGELRPIQDIFAALQIVPIATVDKVRQTWVYQSYEIALDHVQGLGNFVEIEFTGQTTKAPGQITQGMIEFLKSYDVGKISRNYLGYPYMLLFPNETKYEYY